MVDVLVTSAMGPERTLAALPQSRRSPADRCLNAQKVLPWCTTRPTAQLWFVDIVLAYLAAVLFLCFSAAH